MAGAEELLQLDVRVYIPVSMRHWNPILDSVMVGQTPGEFAALILNSLTPNTSVVRLYPQDSLSRLDVGILYATNALRHAIIPQWRNAPLLLRLSPLSL